MFFFFSLSATCIFHHIFQLKRDTFKGALRMIYSSFKAEHSSERILIRYIPDSHSCQQLFLSVRDRKICFIKDKKSAVSEKYSYVIYYIRRLFIIRRNI